MGRNILSAILGCVVLFVFMFVTFSAAYLAMGADTAFAPGGYDVTMTWIIVSTILFFIGAIVAGYVAKLLGKSSGAVKMLGGIVLVLWILIAVMAAVSPKPAEARTTETPNMEAMSKAQTPLWVVAINPIIGLAGVLIGGSLRKES